MWSKPQFVKLTEKPREPEQDSRKAVERFIREPDNAGHRDDLLQRLKLEVRISEAVDALLLAPDGTILLAASDDPQPTTPALQRAVAEAITPPTVSRTLRTFTSSYAASSSPKPRFRDRRPSFFPPKAISPGCSGRWASRRRKQQETRFRSFNCHEFH